MLQNTDGIPAGFVPGMRLAGYMLQEQIGAGGMAVVFKALDERLNRTVALKILAPGLAADRQFRQRFVRESRAAAAVDDPHIVPVYQAAEAQGVLFIAMRYVPGGSVSDMLHNQGPMPPARVAAIISPVASALDAAHRTGLVHRDVKPANMLVDVRADRPDHVYLSDFGLTKGAQSSIGLTEANQVLGTPGYMAPEQIEGREVTGRTDQYALACSAFELLTGRTPFDRDQGMAALWAHLNQPVPPLASVRPGLAAAGDPVFARALAKAQQDRYATCREFADALRDAFGILPYNSGPGLSPPARHRVPPAASPPGAPNIPATPPSPDVLAGATNPAAAIYAPTHDLRHGMPSQPSEDLTRSGAQPLAPSATPHPRQVPYPVRPVSAPYRPPPIYPPPAYRPRAAQPAPRPSRYPQTTSLPWHFAAYLLPVIIPFYGMFLVLFLLLKRDRSVRMSVILGLELGAILTASEFVYLFPTAAPLFARLSVLSFCLVLVLLIICLVQLCKRKQPAIPVLSNIACRVAYGKNGPL